jgi:CubicO group peptidase (beta-lactamase class C family)
MLIRCASTAGLQVRDCGTFSGGGYFGTTYLADPKEKLICLIMTQQLPNSHADFNEQIANIVYGSLKYHIH